MRTENVVPCHPGYNAVSSISGCPSCDHAVLSIQSHVTLSTHFCSSPQTGKINASDTFPSSDTKQRNENKSQLSLRSQQEITDVPVPDCNMAAWSLLAHTDKKRFFFLHLDKHSLGCWIFFLQTRSSFENIGEKCSPLSKCYYQSRRKEDGITHDDSCLMIVEQISCECVITLSLQSPNESSVI